MVRYVRWSWQSRKSNKKFFGRSRSSTIGSRRSRSLSGGEAEADGGCHDGRDRRREDEECLSTCMKTVNMTTARVVVRNIRMAGTSWLLIMFTWQEERSIRSQLFSVSPYTIGTSIAGTYQGEADSPPEPAVGHDELLVPSDGVDVPPHQVDHGRQAEDRHEPAEGPEGGGGEIGGR